MMRQFISSRSWLAGLLVVALTQARADGLADNLPENVRRIPPAGIPVPEAIRKDLSDRTATLGKELTSAARDLAGRTNLVALLPDVWIFHKAVDWALRYDEFFRTNEFEAAPRLLDEASHRLSALMEGKPYWTEARGLVVRGYQSRVDGSIQPYGLVVPESFNAHQDRNYRLDFWFHGRGEQLTELAFLDERMRRIGEFSPRGAFVLHPYGRYCNGSRFAGETDAWESLESVRKNYPIDEERLVVRGFSLGGAACWHMATHHAGLWAAAAPGAGFSETAEFLRVFQHEGLQPSWWEQKLWRLYDSTEHALNVGMVPLVAYSGEVDSQIQAARAMEQAMSREGLFLTHIIGPNTPHRYEPGAKAEINRRIDAIAERGRDPLPHDIQFVTHSLRYDQMDWVILDALTRHWEPARVVAHLSLDSGIEITSTNVEALTLEMGPGLCPLPLRRPPIVRLDGRQVMAPMPGSDRSWRASFHRGSDGWQPGVLPEEALRKRHALQGPIDDAFMDAFLFVRPTGTPLNSAVGDWVAREQAHAIEHWRRQFRGDAPIKDDQSITDQDIAQSNLVLWGDPQSNTVLGRISDRLPIHWTRDGVQTPDGIQPSTSFVPLLIYPNPLNPNRYVVLNSGFTFREYDYLNNARQTPKLPDWAILDITQPVTSRTPGRIAAAGFFGERWEWLKNP